MLRGNVSFASEDIAVAAQDTQKERKRRRALGIYYTPPEAAKALARWVIQRPDDSVLEPSFGGCAMLAAAIGVYQSLGNHDPSEQLYGYDVDPAAFLHLAQMGIDNDKEHFKKQDFLKSAPNGVSVSAVLANPPFVSYHRLNKKQRELNALIKKRYLPTLPGRASLWAYFLLHSLAFLRSGGRMAYVLPNAIGFADYAKPLLQFLCTKFAEVELVHVSQRLFIQVGADERTSLLFLSGYRPDGMEELTSLRVRDVKSVEEIFEAKTNIRGTADVGMHEVRLRASEELANLCGDVLTDLGSVATVKIGEVVGNIPFFVKPLAEWAELGIEKKYLVPLLTRAGQVSGLSLQGNDGEDKRPSIPYLLCPPNKRTTKAVRSYLSQYLPSDVEKNKTFARRPVWYVCSYDASADAFVGSMSHDYPKIIENDLGVSCSNAFYKVKILRGTTLATYLPMLSLTTPLRLSAEILGRVRGSGGIKLEPSDVRKLCIPRTLPTLPAEQLNELKNQVNAMVESGNIAGAGQLVDEVLFVRPGLIGRDTMASLQDMRRRLTDHRLNKRQIEG
ncbi:MAG: hypothetical protein FDZ72_04845 [Betaproteobacteria bacterium]|nr:MAG: hypothetical protein FDZ72_04845 [Betaproteobacteria bacterium]